jgi:competence protein ComGC
MILKNLDKKGETIVEVLLAIAVLASVLGGTLAISARSKNTIQANHERYQAQLIANSQADNLKIFVNDHGTFTGRCLVDGISKDSEAECKMDNGDNADLYDVYIDENPDGSGVYVIKVFWDSLVSDESDRVELVYAP